MEIHYAATTPDALAYFENHTTMEEASGVYYDGFDLVRPLFGELYDAGYLPELGCQYLLALEAGEVVGVLKWKRYRLPDHAYVPEDDADAEENYLAIRFVDVKQAYRQTGIAKALLRAFSEREAEELPIVGGRATPAGERANIHRWVARELHQPYYIDEVDLLEQWENARYAW